MAEMTDDERLKWAADKVAALLAKAESTTAEEAEALTEQAMKIMTKYSIERTLLDVRRAARGEKLEQIIKWTFEFTGTYHRGLLYTFNDISTSLGLQASFRRGTHWSSLTIYGFESDVEQAKLLITSLQLQLAAALTSWWKTYDEKRWLTAMEKFKARRTFMFAFGRGVERRLRASRRAAVQEAESESPGTALVLRDRSRQLADYYATLGVKGVKIQQPITDYDAYTEGYRSGQSADTGDKQVGNKRLEIEA